MKTLKVKSILLSLFAMMAVAVFMTSCGQEEVITNEITESNLTELAERLANDADYQAVAEIRKEIDEDLTNFIQENGLDVESNPSVLDDFAAKYPHHKQQLDAHSANLKSKFPELILLSKDEFAEVSSTVSTIQNEISLKSCWSQCNAYNQQCAATYYYQYLCGQISYNQYLAWYRWCVRTCFNPCMANC